jgi:hypothetical protein
MTSYFNDYITASAWTAREVRQKVTADTVKKMALDYAVRFGAGYVVGTVIKATNTNITFPMEVMVELLMMFDLLLILTFMLIVMVFLVLFQPHNLIQYSNAILLLLPAFTSISKIIVSYCKNKYNSYTEKRRLQANLLKFNVVNPDEYKGAYTDDYKKNLCKYKACRFLAYNNLTLDTLELVVDNDGDYNVNNIQDAKKKSSHGFFDSKFVGGLVMFIVILYCYHYLSYYNVYSKINSINAFVYSCIPKQCKQIFRKIFPEDDCKEMMSILEFINTNISELRAKIMKFFHV